MRLTTFPDPAWREAPSSASSPGQADSFASTTWACPTEVSDSLSRELDETSGAVILSGPAGSGKTTTIYACLRELLARTEAERSLASLEDPIESAVEGVAQAQVNLAAGTDPRDGPERPASPRSGGHRHRRDPRPGHGGDRPPGVAHRPSHSDHLPCRQRLRSHRPARSTWGSSRTRSGAASAPWSPSGSCGGYAPSARPSASTPKTCSGCRSLSASRPRLRRVRRDGLPGPHRAGRAPLARPGPARPGHPGQRRMSISSSTSPSPPGMINRWERACQAVDQGLTSPGEVRRVLGVSRTSHRRTG